MSDSITGSIDSVVDQQESIRIKYQYWRLRIFYSIYVGYALFYFTRKSFIFAMPALMSDLGFSKVDVGFLGSLIAVSYGLSKFISGVISDRSRLRVFMGIGLLLTGVFNILFGMSSSIVLFAICIGLNGFFQGWGAPPCAKLLTSWYSHTERGRWWAFWNTSHNIGGAIIPILCACAIQYLGWRYAMYIPGILAIVFGLLLINRIRDKPEDVGLPSIETFHDTSIKQENSKALQKTSSSDQLSFKQILLKHVFGNKCIWLLAASYFFVYIIRTAINDWFQLYLIEDHSYSIMTAGLCVFWFEIGGVFGSLSAGYLSDIVFNGRRGLVNIIFMTGIFIVLLTLLLIPISGVFWMSLLMFLLGFLIFGPQMLIGMAAAEFATVEATGAATGFTGLFAYAGAAFAGWPVGKITHNFGWMGFFAFLLICSVFSVLLLFPVASTKLLKAREA